jgi:hypothetical protein
MLNKCEYIAIKCPCAGEGAEVRQAVPSLPASETIACPQCHQPREFTALGAGYTERRLPFHEIYRRTVGYASVQSDGRRKIPWRATGHHTSAAPAVTMRAAAQTRSRLTQALRKRLNPSRS